MGPVGLRESAIRDARTDVRVATAALATNPSDPVLAQNLADARQRYADAQQELTNYRAAQAQANAQVAAAQANVDATPDPPAVQPVAFVVPNNSVHPTVPPRGPQSSQGGSMERLGRLIGYVVMAFVLILVSSSVVWGKPMDWRFWQQPAGDQYNFVNPDRDFDGLTDAQEAAKRTDPNDPDTDNDGFRDGDDPNPVIDDRYAAVPPATSTPSAGPTASASTTPTMEPSSMPTQAPSSDDPGDGDNPSTGEMPALPATVNNPNGWVIDANAEMDNDPIVRDWLARLKAPAPEIWGTFPNIPNPDVPNWDVANGMEYGVADVPFCAQDQRCDFPVPGWHYRLITANYGFMGMTCDSATEETGCMLLLINVGEESYYWRDQMADAGFSVPGRYWNGDKLDEGVWGLVSHASANMLNMETSAHPDESLNFGDAGTNAGANCGQVDGCQSVHIRIVIHAVDRILAVAQTTVSR